MRHFSLLACLLCFFLAGCIVDRPLSDPVTSDIDESLLGHWTATIEKDNERGHIHLFIGKHKVKGNPDSIIEIVGFAYGEKN